MDRYVKVVLTLIAGCLLWLCVWGSRPESGAVAAAARAPAAGIPDEVRAHRFIVADSTGTVRLVLGEGSEGNVGLWIRDARNREQAYIVVSAGGKVWMLPAPQRTVSVETSDIGKGDAPSSTRK